MTTQRWLYHPTLGGRIFDGDDIDRHRTIGWYDSPKLFPQWECHAAEKPLADNGFSQTPSKQETDHAVQGKGKGQAPAEEMTMLDAVADKIIDEVQRRPRGRPRKESST